MQGRIISGNQKRFWRYPSDGKRFVVRANEKLTAFVGTAKAGAISRTNSVTPLH
jgi:hypothetical protein